jgi:hypothetical protein
MGYDDRQIHTYEIADTEQTPSRRASWSLKLLLCKTGREVCGSTSIGRGITYFGDFSETVVHAGGSCQGRQLCAMACHRDCRSDFSKVEYYKIAGNELRQRGCDLHSTCLNFNHLSGLSYSLRLLPAVTPTD